jgi:hypothetical protein
LADEIVNDTEFYSLDASNKAPKDSTIEGLLKVTFKIARKVVEI